MVLVVLEEEVLVLVVEDALRLPSELQRRVRVRLARQLLAHLLVVVVVNVAIATRPDEVARFQPRLLRDHQRQERVARDVERNAEEQIGAALVELARQLAIRHVELEQCMARRECHLRDVGRVVGHHHQTT